MTHQERTRQDAAGAAPDDGPSSPAVPAAMTAAVAPEAQAQAWSGAVGRRVRALRERVGLTPHDAVERVRATEAGEMDGDRWRGIEAGTEGMLGSTLVEDVMAMASVLGVTPEQLVDIGSPLPEPDNRAGRDGGG